MSLKHSHSKIKNLNTLSTNKPNSKGFTLIELLVVIAVIGIISSILLVGFKGARESAYSARGKANRKTAVVYCLSNPGSSIITALNKDGEPTNYPVYCDKHGNMWAPTLHKGMDSTYGTGTLNVEPDEQFDLNKFKWAKEWSLYSTEDVWLYTYGEVNDCNEVKSELMEQFPACNACATLNYAGFSEGWRLPYQTVKGQRLVGTDCDTSCGTGNPPRYYHCASGRQLWDYGAELCPEKGWGTDCDEYQNRSCTPLWEGDDVAQTAKYWSATQAGSGGAWCVDFYDAAAFGPEAYAKDHENSVRCFLGQW